MYGKGLIGIKVGSRLLAGDGGVNKVFVAKLCQQIAVLFSLGYRVFLVSSGAVLSDPRADRPTSLRASIGWPRLTNIYGSYLEGMGIETSVIPVTDRDLAARDVFVTMDAAFKEPNILVVLNANDPVDGTELRQLEKCADNDRLFKMICLMIKKIILAIIAFDQPGIWHPDGYIVRDVRPHELQAVLGYARGSDREGSHERMRTKINAGGKLAAAGIPFKLAPGLEENFIIRAVQNEPNFGTTFHCR